MLQFVMKGKIAKYFDWNQRQESPEIFDNAYSHQFICKFYGWNEKYCGFYSYDPIFNKVDTIKSQPEKWMNGFAVNFAETLDFNTIAPLIHVRPVLNPLAMRPVESVSSKHIRQLESWAKVTRKEIGDYGSQAIGALGTDLYEGVADTIEYDLTNVMEGMILKSIVKDGGNNIVRLYDAIRLYTYSFFKLDFSDNAQALLDLWYDGLVPSFDGITWRLHSGYDAKIVYRWIPD